MDNLEIAKAMFGQSPQTQRNSGQTSTAYGIAMSDSSSGAVMVNLGGDTVSEDDDQVIEVETTFAVFEGDEVIVQLVGADGTGKAPCVIGVVGRGDQMQNEIDSVTNYVWNDAAGLHVSTQERSVQGANILLDSDSLDIRNGNSNSEADQTVYASFGREVTVGSRASGSTSGDYSQVFGNDCIASGNYSHAEGRSTTAEGNYSHAEGSDTEAKSNCSHAEGSFTHATALYAHAEGWGSNAGGHASHAEGEYTITAGESSHAEGRRTIANGKYQHAQGTFNVADDNETYADIIGNGTGNIYEIIRSNAYNMDWNGNAEFQGEVYVGGCTPNGETPYPVVRYNTSNSKQEYYDKVNSTWAQVPGGGGGGGWTSLWTNSDPSSNYAAQTEAMDLSAYTWIAIIAKTQTTGTVETTHLVRVGSSVIMSVPNLAGTQYFYKRQADVTTSGITFGTGYRNNTGTSGANYCIPVAVYGIC